MNVNRLKGLLVEKGFTYKVFAEKVGISTVGLSVIMKNKRTSTDTLLKMCEILEVESKTLLGL